MSDTNYVYIKSEPNLYTVGFYRGDGRWEPESDWTRSEDAAAQVHYLNGGQKPQPVGEQIWPPQYGKAQPSLSPEKIARDAIGLFLEYRDRHGKTEEEAKAYAIQEVLEGIQAIKEIEAGEGELRPQLAAALDHERRAQEQLHALIYGGDQEQGIEI